MSETTVLPSLNPKLEFTEGKLSRTSFLLNKNEISIGRVDSNDVVLSDVEVSSQHAKIICIEPKSYKIVDLNSTNGTLINGQPIKEAILNNGDIIEIRPNKIIFISPFSKPQSTMKISTPQIVQNQAQASVPPIVKKISNTNELGSCQPQQEPRRQPLMSDEMYCPECAQVVKRKAVICVKCGCQIKEPNIREKTETNSNQVYNNVNNEIYSRRERKTAGVAIFLNMLWAGLGYFYVGQPGYGIFCCFVNLCLLPTFPIGPFIMFIISSVDCYNKIESDKQSKW